jgi:glycosyltransferase involved in cell wall biosynthesis
MTVANHPDDGTQSSRFPLVSVVIPMYNHASYVAECLDSILSDGYPNLEVLILDDGSTDSSFEVVQQWRRRNPSAFGLFQVKRQQNQGAAKTANELIRMSSGDYITPLASDDKLFHGGIHARVRYLQENPQLSAVFGDSQVIDEHSNTCSSSALFDYRKSDRLGFSSRRELKHELVMRWTVPGPVLLLRRDSLLRADGVGLYAEDGGVEDREFFLRLLAREALGFIPVTVASYRIHVANSCRPKTREARLAHYKARYISEVRNIHLFRGCHRLFLKLSTMRLRFILSRLEDKASIAMLGELFYSALMRMMYYSIWLGRRIRPKTISK